MQLPTNLGRVDDLRSREDLYQAGVWTHACGKYVARLYRMVDKEDHLVTLRFVLACEGQG